MSMKNIEVTELKVQAKVGTHLTDCLRESIALAMKEWNNVHLSHNGESYLIRPGNLTDAIEKENIERNDNEIDI